jgi:hypothetical protein
MDAEITKSLNNKTILGKLIAYLIAMASLYFQENIWAYIFSTLFGRKEASSLTDEAFLLSNLKYHQKT